MTYDSSGRLITWAPTTGPSMSTTYDIEDNQITSTPTPITGGVKTRSAFDADGLRLARKTTAPKGEVTTVVYPGDTEITRVQANAGATGTATGKRHFRMPDGMPLAVQQSSGWSLLFADRRNSIRLSFATGEQQPEFYDYYPFGGSYTAQGQAPAGDTGNRGYLDKTLDPSGDIRLDVRPYKPYLSVLTIPDSIFTPSDPQSANPYAYSRKNPVSASDASGARPVNDDGTPYWVAPPTPIRCRRPRRVRRLDRTTFSRQKGTSVVASSLDPPTLLTSAIRHRRST